MGKEFVRGGFYVALYDFLSEGFFTGWLQQDSNPQPLNIQLLSQTGVYYLFADQCRI